MLPPLSLPPSSNEDLEDFFKLGFTPCKAKQTLQDMKLQEKEAQKIKADTKSL